MDYILHLIIVISLAGILTFSLNYIAGYAGIMSVSHLSFYGVGAYSTALLMMNYHVPFLAATLLGMLITAVVAYVASFPILKLKDDSLVLVSIGFATIIYSVLLNWQSLTNGALGLSPIPEPDIFGFAIDSKVKFLVLALLALLITFLTLWWITRSAYGIVMKSIREDETKAMSVGHNAMAYKRSVFVLGAAFAALGGSLFATYLTVIEPKSFQLLPSFILLVMVILGGFGNLKGSILGALFMVLIPEFLRFLGLPTTIMAETQQIIYGSLVVILMFLRPQGLLGEYKF